MLDRVTARFDALYSPSRSPPTASRRWAPGRSSATSSTSSAARSITRFVFVALGAIGDALLPVFVGWIVGMLATTAPGDLWSEHGSAFAASCSPSCCCARSSSSLDQLMRNHALTPNLIDLVRWQSHWHVIRQSWTFFQNDFAGRIGNKVMQAGEAVEMAVNTTIDAVWYAAVFLVVAIIVLAGMDAAAACTHRDLAARLCRALPLGDAAHRPLSEELSEARSVMVGRMVDSYTNIQTLKTFADDGAGGRLRGGLGRRPCGVFRRLMAIFTTSWSLLLPPQRPAGRHGHLDRARRLERWHDDDSDGRHRHPLRAADHEHLGLDPRGRRIHLPPDRHRARSRWRRSPSPLTLVDAPDAKPLVVTRGEIVYDKVHFDYWRGTRARW